MLCCLGPLQVGHKSMNIVWIHELKLDEQSRPKVWQWHIFFHLDYICDALWILLLVNLCKEWVFADLPILHNICCFLWFAGYQLLGQILMDGDLFLLTFESWWVDITFALWHGENAPCYFHHDMVHTAAIVTKLLLYELFVVCLFFVFFSMVNPYKVSWQTGRSQDLDQEFNAQQLQTSINSGAAKCDKHKISATT